MSRRVSKEEAEDIKKRHSAGLLTLPGVFSVGLEKDSSGEFLLKIGVDREQPMPALPTEVEGLRVIAEPRERLGKLKL